ncbi:ABC transporter permease [Candidatus Spongiisocius sp.]|uniref:ABC transporter permease n=1 Tax=Candidatus Spongiisocius sp. TaxID=3101273 RepID=UPI003B58D394
MTQGRYLEETGPAPRPSFGAGRLARFVKGVVWLLVVVLVAVSITFALSRIVPADPARLAAGLEAGPEQVERVRQDMGLDDPVMVQYVRYITGLVRGDFGDSIRTRQPILDDVVEALPASIELIVVSFTIFASLGILAGIVWAYWPRGVHAVLLRVVAVAGSAVPVFWVGLVLQIVLAARLGWFPVAGNLNHEAAGIAEVTGAGLLDALIAGSPPAMWEAARVLFLPVMTIVIHNIALTIALMRSSLADQLDREYVRAARARGLSEWRVVVVDALRNALNPVVTMLGLQLGWLLGGVVIVEVIFSWPGIGLYAFSSFQSFDYNAIMAITVLATAGFVLVNALVGQIYPLLDPRIKEAR